MTGAQSAPLDEPGPTRRSGPRFRRGWRMFVGRSLLWLYIGVVAVAYLLLRGIPVGVLTHPDLPRVSALTGLQFPSTAQALSTELLAWRRLHLRAQVRMSRVELAAFRRSLPAALTESHAAPPWLSRKIGGGSPEPWLPAACQSVTYRGSIMRDGRTAWVLVYVTLDEPGSAMVWIDWVRA